MMADSPADDSPSAARGGNDLRRRVGLAAVTLVIPAALIVWLTLSPGPGGQDSGDRGVSTSAGSSAGTSSASRDSVTPAPGALTPGLDPTAAIPALQPVPLDATVDYGNGVTLSIDGVTQFEAQGHGAGEFSGPALRVTIRITNLTGQDLGLDTVTVNLASGVDRAPAPPVSDEAARPFSGTLPSGDSADGVYSFTVAQADLAAVTVTLNYTAGAVSAVFTGSVS